MEVLISFSKTPNKIADFTIYDVSCKYMKKVITAILLPGSFILVFIIL